MAVAEVPFDLVGVKLAAPVGPAGHRGEGGRDRPSVRVDLAFRDRGRARRVRQDDAAREVGRGRSASVRVGRARRPRRRRGGVPAIHRGRDSRRRTGPGRGVRGVVGSRGIHLVQPRPTRRERAGGARAPAGAGARRSPRRRQPVLSGRARSAVRVRSGRLADRGREQGRPGTAACPLAGARSGARDRRAGPPAGRAGGQAAA